MMQWGRTSSTLGISGRCFVLLTMILKSDLATAVLGLSVATAFVGGAVTPPHSDALDDKNDTTVSSSLGFDEVAYGGTAGLLKGYRSLKSYLELEKQQEEQQGIDHANHARNCESNARDELFALATKCRESFLSTGIAHVPNFVRSDIVDIMKQEAEYLHDNKQAFYSMERHTVYQEERDVKNYPRNHPRNALQNSSKWIMDYDRIPPQSPLRTLYTSPEVRAFVSFVVRPENTTDEAELFESGCAYNAAYYNIYDADDRLGWHFDRSDFGINLELQPAANGGVFELDFKTRLCSRSQSADDDPWCYDRVQRVLDGVPSLPTVLRIAEPPVRPGSLVLFAGALNLHRITPVDPVPRINAIMTYERQPNQSPNAYSLQKFFGR